MKRLLVLFTTLTLLMSVAWAVSLTGAAFIDNGLTMTMFGVLTDLASEDAVVTMQAVADTDRLCLNPAGKAPKGQNKGHVKVKAVQEIPAADIVAGEAGVAMTTANPDCPNPKWTQTISTMAFTSARITVEQPVGVVVLELDCDFVAPTADGAVAAADVVCVENGL